MSSSNSIKVKFNLFFDVEGEMAKNTFFSHEDWEFIKNVSSRFPERKPSILERFAYFSWCSPQERPMLALELLKKEPRRGLVQRGYAEENVQSVYDHTRKMSRILGAIFKHNQEAKEKYHGNRARKIIVHDLGEAITTDFTPVDLIRISSDEKVRLEDLSMRLIFENSPVRYNAYVSYKNKETIDDELVKVADVLELLADIDQMKVSPEIRSEIMNSCNIILRKYPQICRDLNIGFIG